MSYPTERRQRSLLGLDARLVTLLGYLAHLLISVGGRLALFAWLVPAAVLLAEKRSQYVRFHAAQAFVLNRDSLLCWLVIGILRDSLASPALNTATPPVFLAALALLLILLRVALTVANAIAAIQALECRMYQLPVVGVVAAAMAEALRPCDEDRAHPPGGGRGAPS